MFSLPDAVEVYGWECPDRSTIINGFTAWGEGPNSTILVGFNDGDLVRFNTDLKPLLLYHLQVEMSYIHNIDTNGDGRKEALIGLKDGSVVILDDKLRIVGRQNFPRPPVPVQASDPEFGEFVVISEGKVCGWSVAGVEFKPLPSRFMVILQQWGLYVGVLVILVATGVLYIHRRNKSAVILTESKSLGESTITISDFAKQVLAETGKENIRETICKDIISQQKGKDSFDYYIFLLGDFEIYIGAASPMLSHLKGIKCRSLFNYLLVNRTKRIHKEKLMDLFWQDSEPARADHSLRMAIYSINKELQIEEKGKAVVFSEDCYYINSEYRLFIDIQEFERLIVEGDRTVKDNQLDQAIECYLMAIRLYAGDLLTNLYESCCDIDRETLRNLYVHALKQTGHYMIDSNQPSSAIGFLRKALKIDEYSEELHIEIMRCHAAIGGKKAVKAEYQHLQKLLLEEFNASPSEEITRIYQSLTC